MSTYRVSLVDGFPYAQRIRSDITVFKDQPYEGELSDEQLEAIKADEQLKVVESKAPKPADDEKPATRQQKPAGPAPKAEAEKVKASTANSK